MPDAIDRLLDSAFGADRRARTAYRLREGCTAIPALSFSAWDGAALVGTLQSWPVALVQDEAQTIMVMVGPVAVDPAVQGRGIGRALMDALIAAADAQATAPLMMIGDPDYYGRFFGFTADATGKWTVPGPVERRRLLARGVAGRTVPDWAGSVVSCPDP
jgi:predicted N-acetyltransferase YhbS